MREGAYYVFHLEPPLDEDGDLAACLAEADERYPRLRLLLGQGERSAKERERLVKVNYWLFVEPRLPPEHARPGDVDAIPADLPVATGEDTPAGIAFAQRGMRWADLADKLAHEEVHAARRRELGLAPSLLRKAWRPGSSCDSPTATAGPSCARRGTPSS